MKNCHEVMVKKEPVTEYGKILTRKLTFICVKSFPIYIFLYIHGFMVLCCSCIQTYSPQFDNLL